MRGTQPPARTVLFLHGSEGGYGADRQLYSLATGLDPARFRPVVVLPERGDLGGRLEEAGVEVQLTHVAVLRRDLLRGSRLAHSAALLAHNRRVLGALARERRAAVVHSNTSLVLCGQAVARQAGAAHLLHVREIYRGAGGPAGEVLWPLLKRRFLRADAVACVSEAVASQFGGSDRVFVVYDGVDPGRRLPTRSAARRELNLDPNRYVVAVIGRISDWKGQQVLAHALAERPLAEIGAVGVCAGDTAPGQEHFERHLRELSDELGLGDRMCLLGFRDDVETVLAAADAVAVPSTRPDSLPNSALEAATAGLPLVATDSGGQREIIQDGVTGRLVEPGSPSALAAALRALADNPRATRLLAEAAGAAVRERFDRARMLDRVQESYDRMLHSSSSAVRKTAWLLPTKELPVSEPAAPQLRFERMKSWLSELGYHPVVLPGRGLLPAPGIAVKAMRDRPALVLTNSAASAPTVAAVKRLLGDRVRVVVDVMGLHSLEIDQALSRAWPRAAVRRVWLSLERLLLRSADLVLTVNDHHASLIRRRYRPGGVHTLRDAAEAELAALAAADRATLGVPADTVAVGFVGALVYSRLEPLFAAWEELSCLEAEPRVSLVLIGDGPDLEPYRQRAAQAGWLGRSVFFLGALERRQALGALRVCDIAYSDCWTEAGFPFKLFEYMALGMPIVTEGKPQTSEVLEEGRDALFFRTPHELARSFRRLADVPELREQLGAEARRTFLRAHTVAERAVEFATLVEGDHNGTGRRHAPPGRRPELISVVMPIRNAEAHVGAQLASLGAQTYADPWELVVVDNGCTDRSVEIIAGWRDRLPSVVVVDASDRRGLNHARNAGARAAHGDFLAFCDADDVAAPGWLAALAKGAADGHLVGGRVDDEALNAQRRQSWESPQPMTSLPSSYGFLSYPSGGNCGVWAHVAREIGWDESFLFGASDIEFGWRAQLAGFRVAFAPDAVMRVRYRGSLPALVKQYFRYGVSEPHLFRRFRRHGLPRSDVGAAFRTWGWLARHSLRLLRTHEGRGRWLRVAALGWGRICGSLRWRVVYL